MAGMELAPHHHFHLCARVTGSTKAKQPPCQCLPVVPESHTAETVCDSLPDLLGFAPHRETCLKQALGDLRFPPRAASCWQSLWLWRMVHLTLWAKGRAAGKVLCAFFVSKN